MKNLKKSMDIISCTVKIPNKKAKTKITTKLVFFILAKIANKN